MQARRRIERGAVDRFELGPGLGIDDLVPGDLVITEIMWDPNFCSDANCEYVEVTNVSGMEVDLMGLRIQDSNFNQTGTIGTSVVVPDGGVVVFGRDGAVRHRQLDTASGDELDLDAVVRAVTA